MRSNFDMDAQNSLATIRIGGVVELSGLLACFETVFKDPAWSAHYNIMIVYERDALLGELTLTELQYVHRENSQRIERSGVDRQFKSALVFNRPDQKVLLELHALAGKNPNLEEQVFANEDKAIAWLTA